MPDVRVVVALGGNALLRRGEPPDARAQQAHVREAAAALAPLAADHSLVVCHGNGPQIGVLARESAADSDLSRPFPLDALGAQTQGMIWYWLARELANAGVAAPIAVVVTRTVVDVDDPAFASPTKFVGLSYPAARARALADELGWAVAADGDLWRRVVPSPEPREVVEIDTVRHLLDLGAVVVCAGGGGVPVTRVEGVFRGAEAVVDKDLTAALIAVELDAASLVLLTDVAAVSRNFGTADEAPIAEIDPSALTQLTFPDGSMGPKVAAAARFVTRTGRPARIGALAEATAVLAGSAGTTVVPAASAPRAPARPG